VSFITKCEAQSDQFNQVVQNMVGYLEQGGEGDWDPINVILGSQISAVNKIALLRIVREGSPGFEGRVRTYQAAHQPSTCNQIMYACFGKCFR
jgi:hypothetical protein